MQAGSELPARDGRHQPLGTRIGRLISTTRPSLKLNTVVGYGEVLYRGHAAGRVRSPKLVGGHGRAWRSTLPSAVEASRPSVMPSR